MAKNAAAQNPYLIDKAFTLRSMRAYITKKQEMDKLLHKHIAPILKKGASVVDLCCGIGHLSIALGAEFPRSSFTGIDQAQYLIAEGKKIGMHLPNVVFETGDIYRLSARHKKKYDVAILWKSLLCLPDADKALKSLFSAATKHIFISSLFYDGDIDFDMHVKEYAKERGKTGGVHYHIYGLPRFIKKLKGMGAKKVRVIDFEIGIDLPRKSKDHLGTYTIPLKSGKRLQMSGAVPMPWKIIHVEL